MPIAKGRWTVRTTMLLVAISALAFAGLRWQKRVADVTRACEQMKLFCLMKERECYGETTHGGQERLAYWEARRRVFEEAARHPWRTAWYGLSKRDDPPPNGD